MFKQDGYKFTMDYAAFVTGVKTVQTRAKFVLQNRGPEKLGVLAEGIKAAFDVHRGTAMQVPLTIMRGQIPALRGMGLDYNYAQDLRYGVGRATSFHCEPLADGNLDMFVEGLDATWFEVTGLRQIQELWVKRQGWDHEDVYAEGRKRLGDKINRYNSIPIGVCKFVVMGTRRAFNHAWQGYVEHELPKRLRHYGGTSNAGYAAAMRVPCARTMAHEWLQMGQVPNRRYRDSNVFDYGATQYMQLTRWADVYEGTDTPLIALTDVLGVDAFLREFDDDLTRRYDGVRHDSGDPVAWGNKILSHYENVGIDPRTKVAVFSDSLNPEAVFRILDAFAGKFKLIVFGIGTDFTNDMGVPALKIVMKLVRYDGYPVVKIPDGSGKCSGEDPVFMQMMRYKNAIED